MISLSLTFTLVGMKTGSLLCARLSFFFQRRAKKRGFQESDRKVNILPAANCN
jgi:hypothetical protein